MFNLFPSKKAVDQILEDAGTTRWASLYQEVVDKNNELLKEVLQLRHLKQENVELMERVNEIDNDVIRDLQDQLFTLKNDYAVLKAKFFKERDEYKAEVEKLKKDIEDYVFEKDNEIEKLKAQKHPMYPIHWGDYDKNIIEFVESEFNNGDPIESVYNLLKKAKELTEGAEVNLDKSLDEQCDEVKKSQNWSTIKIAINDAVQAKQRELYGVEEPFREKTTAENLEEKFVKGEDVLDYFKKEKSWEEAASDLALRVAKLEEQLKYTQKIICRK